MRLSDFDYDLPPDLIARYPAAERSASRLLVVADEIRDGKFAELDACLREGDVLVFNDTRVIPARLEGHKETGGRVEILVERILEETRATAHIRASKSPRPGTRIDVPGGAQAVVTRRVRDLFELHFSVPIAPFLQSHGTVPLPPYLEREAEVADSNRYQTIYARRDGAVAAPTAGLHFDHDTMSRLDRIGVSRVFVTLHVGAGTFQSLREEVVEANQLHGEQVEIERQAVETIKAARASGGRVIAVGTTSVRALEAASQGGSLRTFAGETELFIYPGYQFRCVDAMLTNFHLPKSSLLMLVAAFAGRERILAAYRHAVLQRYRFFSYGDAMLVFPSMQ